ncbi:MAG: CapA family protein, partial [Chloroflexi bacterium]|nr:CapA family protein [Chloroflexota bacterium]
PYMDDLEALVSGVEKAKSQADLVVISIHWGIPHLRATIAQYQPMVAHAAINAGADLILGHHAHILKGIEVYKGKVIFYSLCNWAIDSTPPVKLPREAAVTAARRVPMRQLYNIQLDPEYPTYRFAADARKTIAAKCIIADRRIQRVSFIPALVNKQSQAEPLSPSDPRGEDVIQYVEAISQEAGLNAKFTAERDEVIISA